MSGTALRLGFVNEPNAAISAPQFLRLRSFMFDVVPPACYGSRQHSALSVCNFMQLQLFVTKSVNMCAADRRHGRNLSPALHTLPQRYTLRPRTRFSATSMPATHVLEATIPELTATTHIFSLQLTASAHTLQLLTASFFSLQQKFTALALTVTFSSQPQLDSWPSAYSFTSQRVLRPRLLCMVCASTCGVRQVRALCVLVSSRAHVGFSSFSRRFQRHPHARVQLNVSVRLLLHTLARSSALTSHLPSTSALSFNFTPGFNFSDQFEHHTCFQFQHPVSASGLLSASAISFGVTPGFSFSARFQLQAWFQHQRSVSASRLASVSALMETVTPSIGHTTSEFQHIYVANSTPVSFDTTSGIAPNVSPSRPPPSSFVLRLQRQKLAPSSQLRSPQLRLFQSLCLSIYCRSHSRICGIKNHRHGCNSSTTVTGAVRSDTYRRPYNPDHLTSETKDMAIDNDCGHYFKSPVRVPHKGPNMRFTFMVLEPASNLTVTMPKAICRRFLVPALSHSRTISDHLSVLIRDILFSKQNILLAHRHQPAPRLHRLITSPTSTTPASALHDISRHLTSLESQLVRTHRRPW